MKKFLSRFVLDYLRFFAKIKLSQIKPTIIGVTGSVGKTTTVVAIETILAKKYVVKTTGGTNSETGIPLSILGLKMTDYSPFDWLRIIVLAPIRCLLSASPYDVLVCEMGIDELTPPKNMEYLLSIVRPKIGVFLNVLPVHTLQMKTEEKIAAEKGKLITSLPEQGVALINRNDPLVMKFKDKTKAKVVTFDGTPLSGANAVGKIFNIPPIEEFPIPAGRGRVFQGINNSTLIDQSYNASRLPTILALQNLATYPNRKIAVLGDMRELGEKAKNEHEIVAKEAYKLADIVITIGELTKTYFPADKKLINHFENSYQAGNFLQTIIKKGDVILFKGSQNTIFLETAVEMCLKNKSDVEKLCRRGKFWDKQREALKRITL